MRDRGACMAGWGAWEGGMCGKGGRMCGWEACMAGGGHVWLVVVCMAGGGGGMHGKGVCMVGEMAIAADGTHSTGMHSCLGFVYTCRECHRFSYPLKVGLMQYHDAVST